MTEVAGRAPLTVLHLVGSAVDDALADLSRLYAADALAALHDPARYDHRVAWVEPGGRWRFPAGLDREAITAAPSVSLGTALTVIAEMAPAVAVPQMFCLPGMTTYRGLLELAGVPYVGNRPDAMALGADKAHAKAVVAAAGVAVPDGVVVAPGAEVPDVRLPAVVKPVDADNSVGVALVRERGDLEPAVRAAAGHAGLSGAVLVEDYVELGREVRCGVLETDAGLVCLPLEEYAVDAETKPVRDAADKLRGSGDDLALVAKDAEHAWLVAGDDPAVAAVHEAARACFTALGCRDYGLFDFRLDPEGRPWFLEAGLYCSYAEQSVVAVMAAAAGTPLPDLFAAGVSRALSRAPSRS